MKITKLEMTNFRGIRKLELELHPHTTILFGVNGAGKSSTLDCIAVMMAPIYHHFHRHRGEAWAERLFSDDDIMVTQEKTINRINISLGGKERSWSLAWARKDSGLGSSIRADESDVIADELEKEYFTSPNSVMPLTVYYPVNRAVLEIPLQPKSKIDVDFLRPDLGALNGETRFEKYFVWFRVQEDYENEQRLNEDPNFRDRNLSAARRALAAFLPDFSDIRIRRNPDRMVAVKKSVGQELQIQQLSDGEKCLLATVGDIARRLALADPRLDDPLQGEAVVMIDEVDLHLHPGWQREVIANFRKAFPNCQFILTTHSPTVLSEADDAKVYEMYLEDGAITARPLNHIFGWDCNRILEEAMDTSERPVEMKKLLREYFYLIDQGKLADAKVLRGKLDDSLGADEPELVKADVLIRRREIIGR